MSTALKVAPAPAAPPAAEFGFSLEKSKELAQKWVGQHAQRRMGHWNRVWDNYLAQKADLIRLIDPETGRMAIDASNDWKPNPTEQAALLRQILTSYGQSDFSYYITASTVAQGKILKDDPILAQKVWTTGDLAIKVGMKLSRAIAAWIGLVCKSVQLSACLGNYSAGRRLLARWAANLQKKELPPSTPANEDLIPFLVGEIMEEFASSPKDQKLVLSANGLDILAMSMSTFFTSCLAMNGAYRAGPQQYLADKYTLIAYAYSKLEPCPVEGALLPYKTFRQTIHVDLAHRSAAFMAPYGNQIGPQTHKALRHAIARLIARHHGLAESTDPSWYAQTVSEKLLIQKPFSPPVGGHILPSVDFPSGPLCWDIRLKDSGHATSFNLAWPVPCGNCAAGSLTSPPTLTCCY